LDEIGLDVMGWVEWEIEGVDGDGCDRDMILDQTRLDWMSWDG